MKKVFYVFMRSLTLINFCGCALTQRGVVKTRSLFFLHHYKKLFLFFILYFIQNSILFCATIPPISLEFNIFGFLGASKTFTQTDVKLKGDNELYSAGRYSVYKIYFDSIKGKFGFDAKLNAQMGLNAKINDNFSISSLLEIGYSFYSIDTKYESRKDDLNRSYEIYSDSLMLDCLLLGITEKYNYKKFSIGWGAGVLIPISGKGSSNADIKYFNGKGGEYALVMPSKENFRYEDLNKLFRVPFAPYIKLTVEYEVFSMKEKNIEMGVVLGAYINYNFGMKYDVDFLNSQLPRSTENGLPVVGVYGNGDIYNKYNFSKLDFGITFGSSIKIIQ